MEAEEKNRESRKIEEIIKVLYEEMQDTVTTIKGRHTYANHCKYNSKETLVQLSYAKKT